MDKSLVEIHVDCHTLIVNLQIIPSDDNDYIKLAKKLEKFVDENLVGEVEIKHEGCWCRDPEHDL